MNEELGTPEVIVQARERAIKIYRTEKKDVILEDDGNLIKLPRASGRLTLDIINLLDGEVIEEDEKENDGQDTDALH